VPGASDSGRPVEIVNFTSSRIARGSNPASALE
jgi:hypothetical protein